MQRWGEKLTQSQLGPGPWKRLLVCTDGSPDSQGALKAALALAQAYGHKVYVVNILRVRAEIEAVAPDASAMLAREVSSCLETIQATSAKAGGSIETRVRYGRWPHAAILEEAEDIQPDLIVMGRYGHTGLSQLFMGSTTAHVIGLSPVNVLVVPQGSTVGFSRILIASDGSPCSTAAFKETLAIARQMHAKLVAVSVASRKKETGMAEEILENFYIAAQEQDVDLENRVLLGKPDAAIVAAAQKSRTELIVMGSHGRTGFKRLLLGSVVEGVIGRAACPVLVVKQTAESG